MKTSVSDTAIFKENWMHFSMLIEECKSVGLNYSRYNKKLTPLVNFKVKK